MTLTSSTSYMVGGNLRKDYATAASGALSESAAIVKPSRLTSVTLHFDTAPTTSENFTVTVNMNAGAAYDTVIYSVNPSSSSATSILYQPDDELWLEPGDVIDVAFTNTDNNTWGVQITLIEEP